LTRLDPQELQQYLKVMKELPSGVMDELYFYGPPRYALIAYGRPGIEALYQLALQDSIEAGHETGRALLYLATGNAASAEEAVWLTHRYVDRNTYDDLILDIKTNCGKCRTSRGGKAYLGSDISALCSGSWK
jgi:hypothetical protein